jgi:hypothetical protein
VADVVGKVVICEVNSSLLTLLEYSVVEFFTEHPHGHLQQQAVGNSNYVIHEPSYRKTYTYFSQAMMFLVDCELL